MNINLSSPTDQTSPKNTKLVFLIIIPILLIVIVTVLWGMVALQSTVKDEKIFASNNLDNQVSLSWVTKTPAREWVFVSEKNKLAWKLVRDDKEKGWLPLNAFSLHYVTITDLSPNTTYNYKIYQNLKQTASGTFSTSPKLTGAKLSKNISGQVFAADKQTPASGVIVYLQLSEGAEKSNLLSTLTSPQGKWNLNILSARTSSLEDSFKIASRSAGVAVVETGLNGRFSATFAIDSKTKAAPNIFLIGVQK